MHTTIFLAIKLLGIQYSSLSNWVCKRLLS